MKFDPRTEGQHEEEGVDVSVTPSPEQEVYNQMQGYAYAVIDILGKLYE